MIFPPKQAHALAHKMHTITYNLLNDRTNAPCTILNALESTITIVSTTTVYYTLLFTITSAK